MSVITDAIGYVTSFASDLISVFDFIPVFFHTVLPVQFDYLGGLITAGLTAMIYLAFKRAVL